MPQEFTSSHVDDEETVDGLPQVQSQSALSDLDALLDDIDSVLEENATEFVRGFVQKGGQ